MWEVVCGNFLIHCERLCEVKCICVGAGLFSGSTLHSFIAARVGQLRKISLHTGKIRCSMIQKVIWEAGG